MKVPIHLLRIRSPYQVPACFGGSLRIHVGCIGISRIASPVIGICSAITELASAGIYNPGQTPYCCKVGKFLRYFICKPIQKRLARLVIDMREFAAAGIKTIRAVQAVCYGSTKSVYTGGVAVKPCRYHLYALQNPKPGSTAGSLPGALWDGLYPTMM